MIVVLMIELKQGNVFYYYNSRKTFIKIARIRCKKIIC